MIRMAMLACSPFGNATAAPIWIIGHDPRLTKSKAEASTCFFFDLLEKPPGKTSAELAKRGLAQSVWEYVQELVGAPIPLKELYVTNLCNHFLNPPQGRGTVLIPNSYAEAGIQTIRSALKARTVPPRIILAMSQQVLWHMVRTAFLTQHPTLTTFMECSIPKTNIAAAGRYQATVSGAFLEVCGEIFYSDSVPIVPILHIKSRTKSTGAYGQPMERAKMNIRSLLRDCY